MQNTSSFLNARSQRTGKSFTSLRHQRGSLLISTLLSLTIISMLSIAKLEADRVKSRQQTGELAGDLLRTVATGYNTYIQENYPSLQNNLPVTKLVAGVPVNLVAGAANGQTFAPRVEDLVAMGYLRAGTDSNAYLGGVYRTRLERQPAGCVGVACNLVGDVYIDQPIRVLGTTEMDSTVIGSLMTKIGGDVLVSLNIAPANLTAMGGGVAPNPVAGTPAGVVGVRTGFGSSGFGVFLTLNDPRDPNFLGNVTVAGNINSTGGNITAATGNVGAGTGTTAGVGCSRAELEAAGAISLRSATCALQAGFRYIAGGETEAFADNLRNNAGTAGIRSNGQVYGTTATFTGNMTAGSVTSNGPMTANGPLQVNGAATITGAVTGGSFANTAGTAGIDAAGRVYGLIGDFGSIVINNSAVPGQPCSPPNAAVWGNVGGADVLMRCTGGVWTPAGGAALGVTGGACSTNGATGVSAAGVSLICSNGTWISTTERMGKWAIANTIEVMEGTTVNKPLCPSGSTSSIYAIPQKVDGQWLYSNLYAEDISTTQWRVRITNTASSGGVGIGGNAIAQIGCWYS